MALRARYIRECFDDHTLISAVLEGTFVDVSFTRANLNQAVLSGTFLEADFAQASLVGARICGTFHAACFRGADLAFANLDGSNLDERDLADAYSLRGATMPDGHRYDGRLRLHGD
jgi:uncharacterized protein YjbI with pentapeptide repeats